MQPAHILLTTAALASLAAGTLAQSWTHLQPAPYTSTLARRTGGIAFHPVQGGLVLYGGLQSGPTLTLNDTWTFDGATWTQLSPATTPPPRWGHRMVYDSRRGRIVTFGGRSPTTTATANDTWEWNGADWAQVVTPAAPSARAFYSMVYDERRGVTVLYGTQSGGPVGGNQTWEYDGTTWAQITTATTPPGLETPAMAYDKGRGVTVMFGGWNGTSPGVMYNTTYEYDGVDWTLRTTASSPIARYRAGCVYDDARGRVVVYGGFGNATALQDTWEYDGNDWTQVASVGPTKSTEGYMEYLPTMAMTVHFGGSGPGGTNNETWLYAGASTAIAAPFGRGCATSAGTPVLSPTTRPQLGSTYQLDLTGAPAGSLGLVVHGFSNLQWSLGYLPADLSVFGIGGCRLEISPDATLFTTFPTGASTQSLALPNVPGFVNLPFYSQVFVLDLGAPNGSGGATNAVHGVLGS